MWVSKKRAHAEQANALAKAQRLHEEIIGGLAEGIFLLDEQGMVRPPLSRSLETLFRRRDLSTLSFASLLESLTTAPCIEAAARHAARVRNGEHLASDQPNPLAELAVRITAPNGEIENRFLSFHFRRLNNGVGGRLLLVTVTEITARVELTRELDHLRAYSNLQSACLESLSRFGAARFASFLRLSEASMNAINAVLKKPARESDAFRAKLEELSQEIGVIKREAALLELAMIENLAHGFEQALTGLRQSARLTGTDFLPLAVKLDEFFAQLALVRSMTNGKPSARAAVRPEARRDAPSVTENGTQILPAPVFPLAARGEAAGAVSARLAPAGSLEGALQSLTAHVAETFGKAVRLKCSGLASVPQAYQGVIKNISVQLIRNAIWHGIEDAPQREAAGKDAVSSLQLSFERLADASFELCFEDDGRGLEAAQIRAIAVAKGIIDADAASGLSDRHALKLIFKPGFTTVMTPEGDSGTGKGLAMVRRYIAATGGKVGLSSVPGRHTRFRIGLPPSSAARTKVA